MNVRGIGPNNLPINQSGQTTSPIQPVKPGQVAGPGLGAALNQDQAIAGVVKDYQNRGLLKDNEQTLNFYAAVSLGVTAADAAREISQNQDLTEAQKAQALDNLAEYLTGQPA